MAIKSKARHDLTLRSIKREIAAGVTQELKNQNGTLDLIFGVPFLY